MKMQIVKVPLHNFSPMAPHTKGIQKLKNYAAWEAATITVCIKNYQLIKQTSNQVKSHLLRSTGKTGKWSQIYHHYRINSQVNKCNHFLYI